MTTDTGERTYTVKEAAALSGLPASTLRYYESIGVIAPVARGESSKHRVYTDADMNLLIGVACLAATGMSVDDMRHYMENGRLGAGAAERQIALLSERAERLTGGVQEIRPGDIVHIEPGEEHWHGATADRFMAHVAMQEADDNGQVVTWLDHVTDDEYTAAQSARV